MATDRRDFVKNLVISTIACKKAQPGAQRFIHTLTAADTAVKIELPNIEKLRKTLKTKGFSILFAGKHARKWTLVLDGILNMGMNSTIKINETTFNLKLSQKMYRLDVVGAFDFSDQAAEQFAKGYGEGLFYYTNNKNSLTRSFFFQNVLFKESSSFHNGENQIDLKLYRVGTEKPAYLFPKPSRNNTSFPAVDNIFQGESKEKGQSKPAKHYGKTFSSKNNPGNKKKENTKKQKVEKKKKMIALWIPLLFEIRSFSLIPLAVLGGFPLAPLQTKIRRVLAPQFLLSCKIRWLLMIIQKS